MAHIHEKIDFTVEVFVVYGNKVLLRMHDKYKFWLSVGGHVELDEDPNQAAVREVKEEVGLDIELLADLLPTTLMATNSPKRKELIPPKFMNRHEISPTHEHVTLTYFATSTSNEVRTGGADDASNEWKWVSKDELAVMDLRPDVRYYAEQALAQLSS